MRYVIGGTCMICGKVIPPDEIEYVCPDHGHEGILDITYDYEAIKRDFSRIDLAQNRDMTIWRYGPLLPMSAHDNGVLASLPVGGTPLLRLDRLAAEIGIAQLFCKDDSRLPTASFKDRASAIAVVKAREQNAKIITTASTGNAAAALSGLCAAANQKNVIFVPASAPQAKIAQLLMFGSIVMLVEGTYDDAFELCLEVAQHYGWYNRNTAFNPFMSEGKKTCSYEICEQMGFDVPDKIFVSVGDGCIIGGLHKGLKDFLALGWIEKMPRMYGVQAIGSSYLYEAWKNGEDVQNKPGINAFTVADSICAGLPRDRIKAIAAVRETDGAFLTVRDEEILGAMPDLASKTGIFAEPAGAATWAGILKAADEGMLSPDDRIVFINTGSGLKDIPGAMKSVDLNRLSYHHVKPELPDFDRLAAHLMIDINSRDR